MLTAEEYSACRRHRAPDKPTYQSHKADATAAAVAIVAKLWDRLYLSLAAVLTVKKLPVAQDSRVEEVQLQQHVRSALVKLLAAFHFSRINRRLKHNPRTQAQTGYSSNYRMPTRAASACWSA